MATRAEESAIRDPDPIRNRGRNRGARHRRGLALALATAGLLHGVAIAFLAVPAGDPDRPASPLVVIPRTVRVADHAPLQVLPEPSSPAEDEFAPSRSTHPSAPRETPPIRTPVPGDSPERPTEETIPSTTLLELRGAPLPLVTTETGVARRTLDPDPARLARARAESILAVRFETPVVDPPPELGPTTLEGGGVTIAIPWQGFVRRDRKDDVWRDERCEGGSEKADKPGEAEAKSAQCD